jgi:hypothetical protein
MKMTRILKFGLTLAAIGAAPLVSAQAQCLSPLTETPSWTETRPGFSPDGTYLAFEQLIDAYTETFVIVDAASGMVVATRANTAETTAYSWSPSGHSIAFQEKPHGAPSRIKVWHWVDPSAPLLDLGLGFAPTWGADGFIYFADSSSGCPSVALSRVAPVSGAPRTVIVPAAPARGTPVVSPNGVFMGHTKEDNCAGGARFAPMVTNILTGDTITFGYRPEGLQIGVAFNPQSDTMYWCNGATPVIYSGSVSGGLESPLLPPGVVGQFTGYQNSGSGDYNQAFSPDGARMALLVDAGHSGPGRQLAILDLESKSLSRITTGWYDVSAACWSPAGDSIAFIGKPSAGMKNDAFIYRFDSPLAVAGGDLVAQEDELVLLDGSGSTGVGLTYLWIQVSGPAVQLLDTTLPTAAFVAPLVDPEGATLTFRLAVSDGFCTDTSTVNVTVKDFDYPPVAIAGDGFWVHEGSTVTLDGSPSYDLNGDSLTFWWDGPAHVSLINPDTPNPTFEAPLVGPDSVFLTFTLTVSDGGQTSTDTVVVEVRNDNTIPIADAGPDGTYFEGRPVCLSGLASKDGDGEALEYWWVPIDGFTGELSDPTSPEPCFTAPSVGPGGAVLVFQLKVYDGIDWSEPDEVVIRILDDNDPPECTLAAPTTALLWPPNHKLIPVGIAGVKDPNYDTVSVTILSVTQDEPVNGLGDGDTGPDAVIHGEQVLLRAERSGTGNGRVYVITFQAEDGQGGICTGSVEVVVPKSRKKGADAIDDGQVYESTGL